MTEDEAATVGYETKEKLEDAEAKIAKLKKEKKELQELGQAYIREIDERDDQLNESRLRMDKVRKAINLIFELAYIDHNYIDDL